MGTKGESRTVDGNVVDSLRAAVDAGDVDRTADLVERHWAAAIRADDDLLYRAVRSVPSEVTAEHPAVTLVAELFYPLNPAIRRLGDQRIARIVGSADAALDEAGDRTDDQLAVSRGLAAIVAMKRRGEYRAAADFGDRLARVADLAFDPERPDAESPNVTGALIHIGLVDLLAIRFDSAERRFRAAFRKRSASANHAFDAAGKLGLIYALHGESHLARNWLDQAEKVAAGSDQDWRFASQERLGIRAARMLLAVDRMDWTEFHQLSVTADRPEPTEMWVFVLYARARAALFLQNQRGAIHEIHQHREDVPELFSPGSLPELLLITAEADLLMSLGQLDDAGMLVEQLGDHPLENATAARYYLLTRQLKSAEARSDPANWPGTISRRDRLTLALLAATAQLRLHANSEDRIQILRQVSIATAGEVAPWLFTLGLADSDVVHLLGRHFPEMEPLLAALEKQNIRNPFSTGRPHRALRLTPREQALLQHLAAEHPATRIAEDLEVSPSTIRNHRKNLYRKLGATSRDHAIELARRAGLLKPATPPSSDRSD